MNKAKQRILHGLKNTYCRLQPSKIQGIGVFAIRDIPKGTDPFQRIRKEAWYKFKVSELKLLGQEQLSLLQHFFADNNDGTVYISDSGLNGMDISYFQNNSKKPNTRTIDGGEHFVTLRKIKKGEELTVSYATFDDTYK